MAILRKVFWILFSAIYLIAAPLTILYALGYLFNPMEQTLLQTGLISLQTEPSQAQIWLNGRSVKDKTPTVLRNLKPGTYEIRLQLPGYKPWHRKVRVESEQAIRLEKILLFPERIQAEILGNFPITRLIHSTETGHLIVLQGHTASGLWLFDRERKQLLALLPQTRYENAQVENVFLHPDGGKVLLALRKEGVFLTLFVEFENMLLNSIQRSEVTHLLPEMPQSIQWSSSEKDSLFYLTADTLKRVDFETGSTYPALAKNVRGFASYARRLFTLETGNRFLELDEKGKLRRVILDDPVKSQLIFGKTEGPYSIFFLPRQPRFLLGNDPLALFLSLKGRLISNRLPYFIDEDVQELALAAGRLRTAYVKENELWVIDFEGQREKGFFESGPTPRRIYQGKEKLSNPLWFYEDRYLVFLEGNHLKVQDFEGVEAPAALFDVSDRVHDIALDRNRGFLYFAAPGTDQLNRTKIFEGDGLLPRLVEGL